MVDRGNRGMNAAAHVEVADHGHLARPAGGCQIVENLVDHRFVERALVAIRPEVKFQGFELDAEFIRHIVDSDRGEVGLTGSRADAGEFGTLHVNFIIPLRSRIGKSF